MKNMIGQLYSSQADLIINENEGSIAVYKQDTQMINDQLAEIQKNVSSDQEKLWAVEMVTETSAIFLPLIE